MPNIELQTFLATLPPKEREAIAKLPENQQISIMNDKLKTNGKNGKLFDFGMPEFSGFKVEKEDVKIPYATKAQLAEYSKPKPKPATKAQKSVVANMQKQYATAKANFDEQMKKDGWAGDVADAVSVVWNNGWWNATGNRAKYVREDLAQYKNNTAKLSAAAKNGTYNETFKSIYGVDYNERNIKNYNAKEAKLKDVSTAVAVKDVLQEKFGSALKKYHENLGQYKDYKEVLHGPTGTIKRNIPAKFLLLNIESSVKSLVGEKNLAEIHKKSGIDFTKATDEQKYKFYMEFADKMMDSAKDDLEEKLNGKYPDDYLKEFESASKKAFGTKNNIQERVTKYNASQEAGTSTVKGIAKSAVVAGSALIITASGGTATPLVLGGLTATASVGVEVSDKVSNGIDGDLDGSTLGKIAKNGSIEGAMAYGGTFLAKGLGNLKHFDGKYIQKAWSMATDGASGAIEGSITDLIKDGIDNVTPETIATRALLSTTLGNVKAFTSNTTVLTSVKIAKGGISKSTLDDIKREIKNQSSNNKELATLYNWIEKNPVDFEKAIYEKINTDTDKKTKKK